MFDEGVVEPGKLLVAELGQRIQEKLDAEVKAVPRIGGSIFRQHRDTRFSKDKSPYKTHFDMLFWTGDKKGAFTSAFFLRLTGEEVWMGAGTIHFEKPALDAYRRAVAHDDTGAELVAIQKKIERAGFYLGETKYKRVPKPWGQDHPRADLLKYGALHAMMRMPLPDEARSKKLVPLVFKRFEQAAPVHHWLRAAFES